jgi:hypothetical protein
MKTTAIEEIDRLVERIGAPGSAPGTPTDLAGRTLADATAVLNHVLIIARIGGPG